MLHSREAWIYSSSTDRHRVDLWRILFCEIIYMHMEDFGDQEQKEIEREREREILRGRTLQPMTYENRD